MARSNGQGGRCIGRGRGLLFKPIFTQIHNKVTRGNGQGVLPSSHVGLGRGLPSSKLNAIRGSGLGRGISRGRGLPSSQPSVARRRGQGEADLDNTSHDNNMA
ncbi:unnamed protein product [Prunus armeniaca]|uniref:Uncharacterized protein n=1 Tax=Prunus armeniaca TaxID=36596 RepID=A0A6J5XD33_PRUAR|nr:unnamed protein product [Prunus armeniaca]CAB4309014.1 unnamed protein product [Prunus armeniaca]